MEILQIKNLTKSFGKLNASSDINFNVKSKELLAIIGPNGAGKTTLFNLITGKFSPTSGKIFFDGEKISGLPKYKIVKKGISRSFQIVNLFPDLTLFNNVRIGVLSHQKKTMNLFKNVDRLDGTTREVERILDLVHLKDKRGLSAYALSHGDQKCLEMAMALTNNPKLLLLDEPTAGMSPEETQYTTQLIKDIWEKTGTTIIFTEHDLDMVFSIATRILVLQMGRVLAEGTPEEIKRDPKVRKAYLGDKI
ncbi:MAG: ABC transporter ATP-binding protein [Desulfobacula sp.]|jgi:branched-chain amino acid transport system ATP-binding protein|nr:ABC transporter ATP-binding protein [Desulfobacula sp.]